MPSIIIINGPNLNLLGTRQPEIYGNVTFTDYLATLRQDFPDVDLQYYQTNHEGGIIDLLHQYGFDDSSFILNAGGYTHTSIAIRDAISSIDSDVVEVHISNIKEREHFRQFSYLEEVCITSIIGRGLQGYKDAITYLINK